MKKILFICAGNTCRSPMAEMILKHKLKGKGIEAEVSSAGLQVFGNSGINVNTRAVLLENGIEITDFNSREVNSGMIDSADYAFCMTANHKKMLRNYHNVYTLGEFIGIDGIADPFGCEIEVYRETYRALDEVCDRIVELIDWK